MITLEFEVSGLPPSPNETMRWHWARKAKLKKEWSQTVADAASAAKQEAQLKGLYDKCTVHFHISVGDNRRHDPDNLNWAVTKPALDGLQNVLIADDTIEAVTLSYSYDRTKPRRFKVILSGE